MTNPQPSPALSADVVARMVADRAAGTPGPWRADGPVWNQIIWTDSENRLCFMAHSNGLNDDRDIANSRRIARLPDLEAAYFTLAAENATLRQHNDIRGQNMRDTWEAMQAMRDAINDHIPLPSTESDLLQGPENSVFCEVVATAVIGALATLRASEAAALERVKVLEEALMIYADSCDETETKSCGYDGNMCCRSARAALTHTADKEPT